MINPDLTQTLITRATACDSAKDYANAASLYTQAAKSLQHLALYLRKQADSLLSRVQEIADTVTSDPEVMTLRGFAGIVEMGEVGMGDVVGLEVQKNAVVEYLQRFEAGIDARRTKNKSGVLIYGPEGCGKSLLVKVCAGFAHFNLYSFSMQRLLTLASPAKLIQTLFLRARQTHPSLICISNIESAGEYSLSPSLAIAELLVHLRIPEPDVNFAPILLLSSRPWDVHSAFLRAVERKVYVPLPEHRARKEIIRKCAGERLTQGEIETLATITRLFTAAEIADIAMSTIRKCAPGAPLYSDLLLQFAAKPPRTTLDQVLQFQSWLAGS